MNCDGAWISSLYHREDLVGLHDRRLSASLLLVGWRFPMLFQHYGGATEAIRAYRVVWNKDG